MKAFTFSVLGASPGPGVITVTARSEEVAREAAKGRLLAYNADRPVTYGAVTLGALDGEVHVRRSHPTVVHFDSGER